MLETVLYQREIKQKQVTTPQKRKSVKTGTKKAEP